MTIEEACADLAKILANKKEVVTIGIGDQELVVYLLKKTTLPEYHQGFPVRAVLTGKIRPASISSY